MKDRYKDEFHEQINIKNMDHDAKKWHKAVKKLTKYT